MKIVKKISLYLCMHEIKFYSLYRTFNIYRYIKYRYIEVRLYNIYNIYNEQKINNFIPNPIVIFLFNNAYKIKTIEEIISLNKYGVPFEPKVQFFFLNFLFLISHFWLCYHIREFRNVTLPNLEVSVTKISINGDYVSTFYVTLASLCKQNGGGSCLFSEFYRVANNFFYEKLWKRSAKKCTFFNLMFY